MQLYEIRILNDDLDTRLVFQQQYLNDHAAIRSARFFANPRKFEVWRGPTCIWHAPVNGYRAGAAE